MDSGPLSCSGHCLNPSHSLLLPSGVDRWGCTGYKISSMNVFFSSQARLQGDGNLARAEGPASHRGPALRPWLPQWTPSWSINVTNFKHFIEDELSSQLKSIKRSSEFRGPFFSLAPLANLPKNRRYCRTYLTGLGLSYGVFTRSSKRPANFQQMYSIYTC